MVNRSGISQVSNLICLLVISYIAIGIPLIHPALHDHMPHNPMAHDCGAKDCSVNVLDAAIDINEDGDCPVCNFLATRYCKTTLSVFPVATEGQPGKPVLPTDVLPVKTRSAQDQPRAPPIFV